MGNGWIKEFLRGWTLSIGTDISIDRNWTLYWHICEFMSFHIADEKVVLYFVCSVSDLMLVKLSFFLFPSKDFL